MTGISPALAYSADRTYHVQTNVPPVQIKTQNLSIEELRKKAENGDAEAQFALGKNYDDEKNYAEAVKWYRKRLIMESRKHNTISVFYMPMAMAWRRIMRRLSSGIKKQLIKD